MASIKCGNCKGTHAHVSDVKHCYKMVQTSVVKTFKVNTDKSAEKPATLPVKAAHAKVEDQGMFRHGGQVYKVQKAVHGSGNLYAKILVNGKFEYAKGVLPKLDESERMTLEEAKQYGKLNGVCCNCGKTLTDENSIEAGIGPVCAGKDYWA